MIPTDRMEGALEEAGLDLGGGAVGLVQEQGGDAGYVCIGTDHPGGHHTATFDVDEASLAIGVDVLARTMLAVGE